MGVDLERLLNAAHEDGVAQPGTAAYPEGGLRALEALRAAASGAYSRGDSLGKPG